VSEKNGKVGPIFIVVASKRSIFKLEVVSRPDFAVSINGVPGGTHVQYQPNYEPCRP